MIATDTKTVVFGSTGYVQVRPFLVSRDVVVQRPLRSNSGHSVPAI